MLRPQTLSQHCVVSSIGHVRTGTVDAHVCYMLPQVWTLAAGYLAEAILAGLARVRAKGTAASRGAMSADLAEVPI
jgi:hypothetical protein